MQVPFTTSKSHEHSHSHDVGSHSHGHRHDPLTRGEFSTRAKPLDRDFKDRAFTVGIAGPVGSGKTALALRLCQNLKDRLEMAVITNDIFTKEDGEFLQKNLALPAGRIVAVQTGSCPHAAIREDITMNLNAAEELSRLFKLNLLLIESGGDNLAASFSRQLADYIIYVIDTSGGDKIPRKGGPGVCESDLLVINKCDIAEYVQCNLDTMFNDALQMRDNGPVVITNLKDQVGVDKVINHILEAMKRKE
eukprot:NODE_104_length_19952_cov_0.449000.p9 type:complete len:249 gc:universal NODE_104_length_19952_cov_0.449000:19828-19082(-)